MLEALAWLPGCRQLQRDFAHVFARCDQSDARGIARQGVADALGPLDDDRGVALRAGLSHELVPAERLEILDGREAVRVDVDELAARERAGSGRDRVLIDQDERRAC